MTKAKAATVVAAIVNAGFECRAIKISADEWKVRSSSSSVDVDVTIVAAFVAAQSINGFISEVEYS